MSGRGFVSAITALQQAEIDEDLCAPFLAALPVTGVAISTLGDPFGSETVCASDAAAARLDEIQLDLGEGPCWQALRSGVPVLEPNLQTTTADQWPIALSQMRDTQLGSVFAFPMHVGTLNVGAVDLYSQAPVPLPATAVRDAVALVHVVARRVLHRALIRVSRAGGDDQRDDGRYSRREVHQASGMLAAQTGASAADALLLLRAYAHSAGRTVRDLSADVIARNVDFTEHSESGS
jgi:hypothetical protein